jgi:hypothetical protein
MAGARNFPTSYDFPPGTGRGAAVDGVRSSVVAAIVHPSGEGRPGRSSGSTWADGGDTKGAILSPAFVRFALIGGWPLGSLCIFGLLVAQFGRGA